MQAGVYYEPLKSPGRRRAVRYAVLFLLFLPAAHLAWTARDLPHFGYFQDDGLYFIGAKSLASGSGYRILSLPGQPYQTKYPPLYPLLLTVVWAVQPDFPGNLSLALLLTWLWLPVFAVLASLLFRQFGFGAVHSLILCAVLVLSPAIVFLSINLMAELMFSSLLLASVLLADRERGPRSAWRSPCLAGLLGGAAYLTKSAALPLLVSAPLCYIYRKQYSRAAWFFAGMAPAVFGWTLWSLAHIRPSTDIVDLYYTDYVGLYLRNINWHDAQALLLTNMDTFLRGIGGLILFSPGDDLLGKFICRLLGLLAVAGTVRLAYKIRLTQLHFFAVPYSLLLVVWHYPPNERFTAPLLPLFLAGFSVEVLNLLAIVGKALRGSDLAPRVTAYAISALLAGFVALAVARTFDGLARGVPDIVHRHRSQLAEDRQAFRWISEHVPPDSRFLAYSDTMLYLYDTNLGCRLVLSPMPFYRKDWSAILRQFETADSFARERHLSYVFWTATDYQTDLSEFHRNAIRKLLDDNKSLVRVFTTPNTGLYKVLLQ